VTIDFGEKMLEKYILNNLE